MGYHITQEQAWKVAEDLDCINSPESGLSGTVLMSKLELQAYANAVLDKVLGEQWQPIDTVPVNESVLMLRMGMYGRCGMSDGYKQENGVVVWAYIKEPTHWMHLPT